MKKVLSIVLLLLSLIATAQDGSNDSTFNTYDDGSFGGNTEFNNEVRSTILQPDGKIVVGGNFSAFNGTKINRIIRLNLNGSLDVSFNPGDGFNAMVYSIALQSDGKIIVGGSFTSFNGVERNYIARLNADGFLDVSFNVGTGFNGTVSSAVIQSDGKIIVTGGFDSFNGVARNRIARLHANGTLDSSFDPGTGFNDGVYSSSIQPDGKVIVGGWFTSFNGTVRNRIARLNTDGSLDTSFNPGMGFNGWVTSVTIQPDGKIIVGGDFTSFDSIEKNRIARLNADGMLDSSFNSGSGFSDKVFSIALQPDGKIIVGGRFYTFNGTSRTVIARLNANGSLDFFSNFSVVNFSNGIYSIVLQPDGKIIVGGDFTLVIDNSFSLLNENLISRITKLNTDGSLDNYFCPITGFNSSVESIVTQPDGKIVVGGNFTSFNGTKINRIIRLNSNGSIDDSFNPGKGFSDGVYSIVLQPDGKIIVEGSFNYFNGVPVEKRITRLNSDGSLDKSFRAQGINGPFSSTVLQPNGKIIVAGGVTFFNTTSRYLMARLHSDGSIDTSFNPGIGFDRPVSNISLQPDGKIIVCGKFTSFNGKARNGLARLHPDGSLDDSFNSGTGFTGSMGNETFIKSINVQSDGKIIFCGRFTFFNGIPINGGIVRLFTDGSLDASFNVGTRFVGTVYSAVIQPDNKIVVGGVGVFGFFDGEEKMGVLRLHTDGSVDTTFNPGKGFDYTVHSIKLQPDGNIIVGGSFISFNGIPRTRIARLLSTKTITETTEEALSHGVSLYPNPTNGELNISFEKEVLGAQVIVRNAIGQEVYKNSYSNVQKIGLSVLESPGFYFVEIASNDKKSVHKVLVE